MKTGARGLHPVSSLLFFVSVFLVTLLTLNPYVLSVSLLGAVLLDVRLRGKKAVKGIFLFLLPTAVLITLFNAFFAHYGVTVLFTFKSGNNVTLEAFVCGAVYAFRTVCMILWLFCFNEILSQEKFLFLFAKVSPRLSLVLSMVLRFLPLFSDNAEEIGRAQRGIGNDSKSGSFFVRFKSSLRAVSILITRSLEHAIDTANSMTARGYSLKGRTNSRKYPFRFVDVLLIVLSVLSCVCSIVFIESVEARFNPVIFVEPPSVKGASVCVLFFALCVSPFIFDVSEEKLWSISN